MRGFRLYHPGDRSAAIVPRVGLFRQKNTATEPDSSNGSAPPHIGEAQLTGRSLGTAARRAPAALKPLDIRPEKPRSHNIWCRPKLRPQDVVVKFQV